MAQMKTFIFDIDGTLLDSYDMYMPALFAVLARHGYHYNHEQEVDYGHQLFGISGEDTLRNLNIPEDLHPAIQQEWFDEAFRHEEKQHIFKGIPEVIDDLSHRADTKIAIGTSKPAHDFQQHFAKRYFFTSLFNDVVTIDDVEHGKPEPDMVIKAMHDLNGDPTTTVYVGDTINDLKAAHAAGVNFAGALYGATNPEKINDGAEFLLHQPSDLLKI